MSEHCEHCGCDQPSTHTPPTPDPAYEAVFRMRLTHDEVWPNATDVARPTVERTMEMLNDWTPDGIMQDWTLTWDEPTDSPNIVVKVYDHHHDTAYVWVGDKWEADEEGDDV